jgi:curved DNA-binding protein CbpA
MPREAALELLGFESSDVLLVPTKREVKRAFRTLAVKLHPDVSNPADVEINTERFRDLVEAYELLMAMSR